MNLPLNNDNTQVIEDIHARGRVPLLVGGSDYYIQSLVSRSLLDEFCLTSQDRGGAGGSKDASDDDGGDEGTDKMDVVQGEELQGGIEEENLASGGAGKAFDETPQAAHARLRALDPAAAARLHPNDARRVRRYLEIHRSTGRRPSDIFAEKRRATRGKAVQVEHIRLTLG